MVLRAAPRAPAEEERRWLRALALNDRLPRSGDPDEARDADAAAAAAALLGGGESGSGSAEAPVVAVFCDTADACERVAALIAASTSPASVAAGPGLDAFLQGAHPKGAKTRPTAARCLRAAAAGCAFRPGQGTGDSTSLQRGCFRSNAREKSMARFRFAPERWSLVQT